jgi:CrcB protein
MKILLSIAAGGAFGAVGRYLLMSQVGHWFGSQYPFATLAVNVLGAFGLGALIEIMALVWSPSQEIRAFLVVGVIGGLTTFSTFTMDLFYLMEAGRTFGTAIYVAASVVFCILAFYAGMAVFRQILV